MLDEILSAGRGKCDTLKLHDFLRKNISAKNLDMALDRMKLIFEEENVRIPNKFANAYIDVFDTYIDHDQVMEAASDQMLCMDDLNELLTTRAYEYLQENPDGIEYVRKHNHWWCEGSNISDEMIDKVSYDVMEKVYETCNFVRSIHRKRSNWSLKKIQNGFYSELGRAYNQGTDMKSKMENIRVYCADVKKQLRENIEDLMVVTNG